MKTAGCRTLLIGALALLGGGCGAADVTAVPEPVAGDSATRASYAYSTPYGEMWEVDGEVMPAGTGLPPKAVISDHSTSIDGKCEGKTCDVNFKAYMSGLWHATSQQIIWTIDTVTQSSMKQDLGWSCLWRISPLNCAVAERTNVHEVNLQACKFKASVRTEHAAWWIAWFDRQTLSVIPGPVGRQEKSSFGQNKEINACTDEENGASPGGDRGPALCYEMYLAWSDETGYHEVYLGDWCFGGWAT